MGEVLGAFAGRQDQGLVVEPGVVQGPLQRRQMRLGDFLVGDHEDAPAAGDRGDVLPGGGQQALAHQDIVAAPRQVDSEGLVTAHGAGFAVAALLPSPAGVACGRSSCARRKPSIAARTRAVVTSGSA